MVRSIFLVFYRPIFKFYGLSYKFTTVKAFMDTVLVYYSAFQGQHTHTHICRGFYSHHVSLFKGIYMTLVICWQGCRIANIKNKNNNKEYLTNLLCGPLEIFDVKFIRVNLCSPPGRHTLMHKHTQTHTRTNKINLKIPRNHVRRTHKYSKVILMKEVKIFYATGSEQLWKYI